MHARLSARGSLAPPLPPALPPAPAPTLPPCPLPRLPPLCLRPPLFVQASLGMGDMLSGLDSLDEPAPAASLAGSSSSGALADAAVNAWLTSLPSLSFMLSDKLVLPA